MKINRTSNISLLISSEDSSWNEVTETMIIFGDKILIITNISYKPGFGERYEETKIIEIQKAKGLNPCLLCEDVYNKLVERRIYDDTDKIVKIIKSSNVK